MKVSEINRLISLLTDRVLFYTRFEAILRDQTTAIFNSSKSLANFFNLLNLDSISLFAFGVSSFEGGFAEFDLVGDQAEQKWDSLQQLLVIFDFRSRLSAKTESFISDPSFQSKDNDILIDLNFDVSLPSDPSEVIPLSKARNQNIVIFSLCLPTGPERDLLLKIKNQLTDQFVSIYVFADRKFFDNLKNFQLATPALDEVFINHPFWFGKVTLDQ